MDDRFLPAKAAFASYMAISTGFYPSNVLVEAVLTGVRGIHYNPSNLQPYETELYKLDYEKVIFDDVDRMIEALKRFREDPDSEPELGNWSSHLDDLDPFRDDKGEQRIVTCMRCLQEGFEQ